MEDNAGVDKDLENKKENWKLKIWLQRLKWWNVSWKKYVATWSHCSPYLREGDWNAQKQGWSQNRWKGIAPGWGLAVGVLNWFKLHIRISQEAFKIFWNVHNAWESFPSALTWMRWKEALLVLKVPQVIFLCSLGWEPLIQGELLKSRAPALFITIYQCFARSKLLVILVKIIVSDDGSTFEE